MPPRASTHSPESSAIAGRPVAADAWRALASAFSMNVTCGSSASGTPSSPWRTSSTPRPSNSACSSASFLALLEARTSFMSDAQRGLLRHDQLADARVREIEQLVHLDAREGRAFGRALPLDEVTGAGHDDVHVGVAGRVLDVFEI